jgi:hypothetical protein
MRPRSSRAETGTGCKKGLEKSVQPFANRPHRGTIREPFGNKQEHADAEHDNCMGNAQEYRDFACLPKVHFS